MPKFSTKKKSTSTVNKAGGVAFSMNKESELIHAVLTTFLEDKYYETGANRIERIKSLIASNNPKFVANLAVIARNEFNLRSVSHLLIGELSKIHRGDSLIKNALVASSQRVDDLTEILAYVGNPVPKQIKRGLRNGLLKFNTYQLAKYRGEGNKVSLVDLFNLVHPKVKHASGEQKKAWKALIEGKLTSFDTWETEISACGNDEAKKKKVWESLITEDKLGYMALLRNLNNLIKCDVSEKILAKAIKKLTDPVEVLNSKQLPFRYSTAYKNVLGNRKLSDAISEAMDIAVSNTPEFKGKTLIAIDCSGSMEGDPIQKAAIFGATLLKANKNAEVILYDTSINQIALSGRTPVVDLAHKIETEAMGGGTNTGLVFDYATKHDFDRIIIISDNESWDGYGVQNSYLAYKKATGQDPFVYAIDIQGYGTEDVKGGKVFHLSGWSDRLLDFIGKIEEGETLVKYVRDYKI